MSFKGRRCVIQTKPLAFRGGGVGGSKTNICSVCHLKGGGVGGSKNNICNACHSNKAPLLSGEEVSVESLWVLALVLKVFDNLLKSNSIFSSADIFRAEFIQCLVFVASKGTGFSQQWLLKDLEVTGVDCRLSARVFRVTGSNYGQSLIVRDSKALVSPRGKSFGGSKENKM